MVVVEGWRNVMKTVKTNGLVFILIQTEVVFDSVGMALHAVTELELSLNQYLDDQCDKWPKLYLLSKSQLLHAFATSDPHMTYKRCRAVMPHLSDLIFDTTDVNAVVGVVSGPESVDLMRPVSARSSLVDWLQGIEASLSDRFYADYRALLESNKAITEEIKLANVSLQCKVCSAQTKFWNDFRKIISGELSLRSELKEIFDKIRSIHATRHILNKKLENISFDAVLLLFLDYRDFIASLIIDEENHHLTDVSLSFRVEAKFKKIWDARTSSLLVKYGLFTSTYSMKYLGLPSRIVITPAAEKFFVSLTIASHESCGHGVPVIHGRQGSYKAELLKYLGDETGTETIVQDCVLIARDVPQMQNIVKAGFGCGLWIVFNNVEHLAPFVLAQCLSILSLVRQNLNDERSTLCIPGTSSVGSALTGSIPGPKGKFTLVFGGGSDQLDRRPTLHTRILGDLPDSIRNTFRPLHIGMPSLEISIKYTLAISNFGNLTLLTMRLHAYALYMTSAFHVDESIMRRVIKAGIRAAGHAMLVDMEQQTKASHPSHQAASTLHSVKYQTEIIFKKVLFFLQPLELMQPLPSETELRYICSMFLDITLPAIESSKLLSTVDQLVSAVKSVCSFGHGGSVIAAGGPGVGKSDLIRQAIQELIAVPSTSSYGKDKRQIIPFSSTARVLNPWIMCGGPSPTALHEVPPELGQGRLPAAASGPRGALQASIEMDYEQQFEIVYKQADVDARVFHVDVPSSAHLIDVLPYFMPESTASLPKDMSSICVIWEVCDLRELDPSQFSLIPIVNISEAAVGLVDYLEAAVSRASTNEGKVLRDILADSVKMVLLPCLELGTDIMFSSVPLPRSKFHLASNIFTMFDTIMTASGLTMKSKLKWDEATVKRIFVYCCIWIIGGSMSTPLSTSSSADQFDNWFKEYFEKLSRSKGWLRVFPVMVPQCTVFDSILQSAEENSVKLEWVVWDACVRNRIISEFGGHATQESPNLKAYSSHLVDLESCHINSFQSGLLYMASSYTGPSVVLNTPLSVSLRFYQNCVLHERNNGKTSSILVRGQEGSGKSALVQHLLHDAAVATTSKQKKHGDNLYPGVEDVPLSNRWVYVTVDINESLSKPMTGCELLGGLRNCRFISMPSLICRNLPCSGAVFIEDVNLTMPFTDSHDDLHLSHVIRQMCEHGSYYDPISMRWINSQGQYHVLTTSEPGDSSDSYIHVQRLLRHFLVFCISPVGCRAVHASFLRRLSPQLPEDICDDLLNITHKLILHFRNTWESHLRDGFLSYQSTANFERNPGDSCRPAVEMMDDELRLFYSLVHVRPLDTTVSQILTPVASALGTMTVSTTVDVVRIWERTLCDYCIQHKELFDDLDSGLEIILSNSLFKFPSFGDLVRRERSKHLTAQNVNKSKGDPMAVGYTNNIVDGFIGMFHPAHFRDVCKGRHSSLMNSSTIIDNGSQEFWYSVQRLCTSLLASGVRQGACPMTVVTAVSQRLRNQVITAATLILAIRLQKLVLSWSCSSKLSV
jgi:hypothetical protein